MKRLLYLIIVLSCSFYSCNNEEPCVDCDEDSNALAADTLSSIDKYLEQADTSKTEVVEIKENLQKIEKKYGQQWDFCTCVVANDSVNKAFMKDNLSDKEFDRLDKRSTIIMNKCQAFLGLDGSRTPDDRSKHEAKIRKCLKAAGIKY